MRIIFSVGLVANAITTILALYNCYLYFYKERCRKVIIALFYILVLLTVIIAQIKSVQLLITPSEIYNERELEGHGFEWITIKHITFTGLYWVVAFSMYQLGLSIEMNCSAIEIKTGWKQWIVISMIVCFMIFYAVSVSLPFLSNKYKLIVIAMAILITIVSSIVISNFLRSRVN